MILEPEPAGAQVYVVAPVAFKVAVCPEQINEVEDVAPITGTVFTETELTAVLLLTQPNELVPVTL